MVILHLTLQIYPYDVVNVETLTVTCIDALLEVELTR